MKIKYTASFMLAISLSWLSNLAYSETLKEALEQFELSSLHFVSSSIQPNRCGPIAYIQDPNGYLHMVMVGSMVGKHFGKILSISSEEIKITEVYPEGKDSWKERETVLSRFNENSGSK